PALLAPLAQRALGHGDVDAEVRLGDRHAGRRDRLPWQLVDVDPHDRLEEVGVGLALPAQERLAQPLYERPAPLGVERPGGHRQVDERHVATSWSESGAQRYQPALACPTLLGTLCDRCPLGMTIPTRTAPSPARSPCSATAGRCSSCARPSTACAASRTSSAGWAWPATS